MQERTVEVMGIINRFNVVGREDRILQKQIPESSDKTFLFSPGTVNFLALWTGRTSMDLGFRDPGSNFGLIS